MHLLHGVSKKRYMLYSTFLTIPLGLTRALVTQNQHLLDADDGESDDDEDDGGKKVSMCMCMAQAQPCTDRCAGRGCMLIPIYICSMLGGWHVVVDDV